MRRLVFSILLALAAPTLFAQCEFKTTFDEEDPCFATSSAPPKIVVDAIFRTPEGKDWLKDASSFERSRIETLLRGQVIHLHSGNENDMLVRGTLPLSGGDNTWFWLFVNAKSEQTAEFMQGNSVHISSARHYGYKDVYTVWDVAAQGITSYYHFTNWRYRLIYEKAHPRRYK